MSCFGAILELLSGHLAQECELLGCVCGGVDKRPSRWTSGRPAVTYIGSELYPN
jgi:hypothetical protein